MTPTARRITANGATTIELTGLDPDLANRVATVLEALDITVEDTAQPAAPAKAETRMSAADLDAEAAHLRAARTDAALDEWVRTGQVAR